MKDINPIKCVCETWNVEAEGEKEARPCGSCKEFVSLPEVHWEVVEECLFWVFVFVFFLHCAGLQDLFPDQGLNLCPQQ